MAGATASWGHQDKAIARLDFQICDGRENFDRTVCPDEDLFTGFTGFTSSYS